MASYTSTTITLTPEYARELLEANRDNRVLRPFWVARYTREMAAGEWNSFADPGIAIGRYPDGSIRIINGQHRLTAVTRSGVTLEEITLKEKPVEDDSAWEQEYGKVDTSGIRTVADMLRAKNQEEAKHVGVVSSALLMLKVTLPIGYIAGRVYTQLQKANLYRQYPKEVAYGHKLRSMVKVGGRVLPGGMVCAGMEMAEVSLEKADEFWEQVASGEMLHIGDATHTLRDLMLRNYGFTKAANASSYILQLRMRAYALLAWRHFVQGTKVYKLVIQEENLSSYPVAKLPQRKA